MYAIIGDFLFSAIAARVRRELRVRYSAKQERQSLNNVDIEMLSIGGGMSGRKWAVIGGKETHR